MTLPRMVVPIGCVFLLMLTGCGHAGSGPAKQALQAGDLSAALKRLYPDAPMLGKGSARITYVPNAHILEKNQGLDGLIAESSDGHGLVFKSGTPQIAALKEGDVLVIKGVAARKILAVDRRGGEVLVVTDIAGLRDVVKEGEIHLDAPIKFGKVQNAELERRQWTPSLFDLFATPVFAQGSFSPANNAASQASSNAQRGATIDGFGNLVKGAASFVLGDWKVSNWIAVPVGDRLNIALTMVKDVAGFKARVIMNGFISDFDVIQNMKIGTNFGTTQLGAAVKSLAGQMTFKWEIGKDTPGGFAKEDRIKLPGAITIPLSQYVAGLPLSLEISSALIIHPAITGGQQYAEGGFTVTYNGSMIDTVNNSGSSGSSGDLVASATLDQDKGISAVAPVGMLVAFCLPRFELSIAGLGKLLNLPSVAGSTQSAVDSWIGTIAQNNPRIGKILNNSAIGTGFFANSLKSSADVYAQVVSTHGVTESGSSVIIPCSNVTVQVAGQIGINANLFGKDIVGNGQAPVEHTKDVFNKSWNKNTGGVCASIGK
jgi:hypothetical protein